MKTEDRSKDELNEYDPLKDPDNIAWDKNKPLKWSDFTGHPDPNDRFYAKTVSWIDSKCEPKVTFSRKEFEIINIRVVALFSKSFSCVMKNILESSQHAFVLQHEQVHFDITEIFARKTEKKLQEIAMQKFSCKGNTQEEQEKYANIEIQKILRKIRDEIGKEVDSFNQKYEKETEYGNNIKRQGQYNLQIANLLKQS